MLNPGLNYFSVHTLYFMEFAEQSDIKEPLTGRKVFALF